MANMYKKLNEDDEDSAVRPGELESMSPPNDPGYINSIKERFLKSISDPSMEEAIRPSAEREEGLAQPVIDPVSLLAGGATVKAMGAGAPAFSQLKDLMGRKGAEVTGKALGSLTENETARMALEAAPMLLSGGLKPKASGFNELRPGEKLIDQVTLGPNKFAKIAGAGRIGRLAEEGKDLAAKYQRTPEQVADIVRKGVAEGKISPRATKEEIEKILSRMVKGE